MEYALFILFPLLSALGVSELRPAIQLAWQSNRVKAETLESKFNLVLDTIWLHRWRIVAWGGLYILLAGLTFFIGLWTHNALFVVMSGLSMVLFIWAIGFLVHKIIYVYQKLMNFTESDGRHILPPAELKPWLQYFGVLGQKFRLIPTHGEEAKKFLDKIQSTYQLLMLIPLFFAFFLGLFPDLKIWVMTLVIFVGAMLWLLLARILGEDPKKALRNLKLMVMIWVLGTLTLTKFMAAFPNTAMAWGIHFKPLFEKRAVTWANNLLTPKVITPPAAMPTPSPLPPVNTGYPIPKPEVKEVVKLVEAPKANTETEEPKPRSQSRLSKYAAERARKLREGFPQLVRPPELGYDVGVVKPNDSVPSEPNLIDLPPVKQLP